MCPGRGGLLGSSAKARGRPERLVFSAGGGREGEDGGEMLTSSMVVGPGSETNDWGTHLSFSQPSASWAANCARATALPGGALGERNLIVRRRR